MNLQIQQRVALVCGAGSGLGQAIACSLAQEGVKVAVTGRNREKLAQTVERITQLGGTARAWPLDLAIPEQFDMVIADIREHWGDIDILVNNSGGPPPTLAQGTDGAVWQQQFSVMVASLIQLTDKLLPAMRSRGWGRIITSTSSGVIAPIPGLALSNALRMSLLGWSKTLAAEVAADGVTVNVMVPGRIATDRVGQLDAIKAKREHSTAEAVTEKSRLSIPAGRYGHPHEYGATAAFLASQPASYITGAVIRVDGGLIGSV
ncbi:TPA: SDR family oxidoreductase [Klebsiella variicola]|uniref:SDR family oxidoreductase n=1 Tax=Klebsiella variicola TaxID=244366 RepID=UPI000BCBC579|nr:SDR family oxidoreductase [Klebsiella variicola]EKU9428884.1 SDR family oxidoreductase [Klebsiella variicola]MEA5436122.1 SDR family oxidoreductase [Klebsiella variicola]PCO70646.1 3-oxoacyl-ACP reductase [Klebsiella variicola]HBS5839181.1 SDR family oxidoreductase [Klebsiella variicola]